MRVRMRRGWNNSPQPETKGRREGLWCWVRWNGMMERRRRRIWREAPLLLLLLIFLCFLISALTSPDMLALHSAHSGAFADIFFHSSSFRLKFTFWILKRWTIICHSCPTIIIFPFFPPQNVFLFFLQRCWELVPGVWKIKGMKSSKISALPLKTSTALTCLSGLI